MNRTVALWLPAVLLACTEMPPPATTTVPASPRPIVAPPAGAPGSQLTWSDPRRLSVDLAGGSFADVQATGVVLHTERDVLALQTVAYAGQALTPTAPSLEDCAPFQATCRPTARLDHGHLTEWWTHGPAGLQQGWTLTEAAADPLVTIELATPSGDLLSVDPDGLGATFQGDAGTRWRYTGLAAWDADGAELPAHLTARPDGLAVVVDTAGARWPVTVDPIVSEEATIHASDTSGNTYFGQTLAAPGDIDGDGYPDLLVGANSPTVPQVYAYYGSASGLIGASEQIVQSSDSVAGDYFGRSAAGGDFDADGYADVVVGADSDDDLGSNSGTAFLYYGSATGVVTSSEVKLQASNGASFDYFGGSTATGDLNSDGYDDLVVGAYGKDDGAVYVYLGSASGIQVASEQQVAASGISNGAYFGRAVDMSGDLDGDGFPDLAVGAMHDQQGGTSYGSVYIYAGSASGADLSTETWLPNPNGTRDDGYGDSLSTGGDLNGDGYDDLVVGSLKADLTGVNDGAAYIYYGSASGIQAGTYTELTASDAAAGLFFGEIVEIVPDLDADGFDDLVVATDNNSTSAINSGAAYVYRGSTSGVLVASEQILKRSFPAVHDWFGRSAVGLGDLDGLGAGSLAIGVVGDDSIASNGGTVDIWTGSCAFDADGDGVCTSVDCDDTDPQTYPGAPELPGDGIDQDCDGAELCYADADADGYTDGSAVASADLDCTGTGEATDAAPDGDCDDTDATTYPGASEQTGDAVDSDCDGSEVCFVDADADGYTDGASTVVSADIDCTGAGEGTDTTPDGDCDDTDDSIHPGATEVPGDEVDGDCDDTELCYADTDEDGYIDGTSTVVSADLDCWGTGEATDAAPTGDCDDSAAWVNPGAAETVGDEVDADCDGAEVCWADGDDDGFVNGLAVVGSDDTDCSDPGEGSDSDPTGECNDADATIFPGATEGLDDGIDSDCDGIELCAADADADGYTDGSTVDSTDLDCTDLGEARASAPAGDCDDADPGLHPGMFEAVGDGIDSDCDGTEVCLADADGDGFTDGSTVASDDTDCSDPGEASAEAADGECDDTDASVHPGATETVGDDIDSDCDGTEVCLVDADGDGFVDGTTTVASMDTDCSDPGEATAEAPDGECDDSDATVHPGASELPGDQVDSDCDGTEVCYVDADGDGYGDGATTMASDDTDCTDPGEAVATVARGECDDTDPTVHPGAVEVAGDGIDNDCDGLDDDVPAVSDEADTDTSGDADKRGCSTAAPGASTGLLALCLVLVARRRTTPSLRSGSR